MNQAHADRIAFVALPLSELFVPVCKGTAELRHPVDQNVLSAPNVHIISPVSIRSVETHAQAHAVTMLNAMSSTIIQYAIVAMDLLVIHLKVVQHVSFSFLILPIFPNNLTLKLLFKRNQHQNQNPRPPHAYPVHADQMLNAEKSIIELYARVHWECSAHHQIAVPNVSSIKIVHRIALASHNDAKIRVSVHAASMLAVPHKIISQRALASKDTKAIRMLVARHVKVSSFS